VRRACQQKVSVEDGDSDEHAQQRADDDADGVVVTVRDLVAETFEGVELAHDVPLA